MSTLTPDRIAQYAYAAGFRGTALTTAVAVALAESAGNPKAHNAVPPDNSYGLWQVNMLGTLGPARRHQFHLRSNEKLFDPAVNARAAYAISSHGTSFQPWSTFTNGAYKAHLPAARRAAAHAGADPGPHHGTPKSPHHSHGHSHSHKVVLDLAELRRLATLFEHSADRVQHTRRALRDLAADLEPARSKLTDTALATLIGDLFTAAEAPDQLYRAAERLDRQGRYADRVRHLAEQADSGGPLHFIATIGATIDPFERAVLEAVVGGQIVHSGHTHRHGHDTHPTHVVNGRIPPSQLTPVGDGQRMAKVAGAHFRKMDAAANAAGIDLKVRSGYRTYAEQAVLYDRYIHGQGALAARPGHSTHGLGLSADIDVSDPRTLAWLRKHAARFGFVPDVPSENWHWTYRPR